MADDRERPAPTGQRGPTSDDITETDPQVTFLEELLAEDATVAGDLVELDANTWAIHGTIGVDGDVIMAEYDTEEHARIVLDRLGEGHTTSGDNTPQSEGQPSAPRAEG